VSTHKGEGQEQGVHTTGNVFPERGYDRISLYRLASRANTSKKEED